MLEKIIEFITFHPEITIVGAVTLVQIAPINIDPWSSLLAVIRKLLVGHIEEKLDNISEKVGKLEEESKEDKALTARTNILRFADELYRDIRHEKEYFDNVLEDIDSYEQYCADHPNFKNNRTVMSTTLIKDTYHKLFEEHKF